MPKSTTRKTNQKNLMLFDPEWDILDFIKLKTGKTHAWIIRDFIYRAGKHHAKTSYRLQKPVKQIERMREVDRKRSIRKKTVLQQKKAQDLEELLRISQEYDIKLPEDYDEAFFL